MKDHNLTPEQRMRIIGWECPHCRAMNTQSEASCWGCNTTRAPIPESQPAGRAEPTKCAECGSFTHPWDTKERHSPICSKATITEKNDNIRFLSKRIQEDGARCSANCRYWQEQVTFWQGKFRIVKHENNQLRKKLLNQPEPKEAVPTQEQVLKTVEIDYAKRTITETRAVPPVEQGRSEAGLLGEWRHSYGFIFCGTLRIAKGAFDTNPAPEFCASVFDDICAAMNQRTQLQTDLENARRERDELSSFSVKLLRERDELRRENERLKAERKRLSEELIIWQNSDPHRQALKTKLEKMRALLTFVLSSASPNERDNPTMFAAWKTAYAELRGVTEP